MIHGGKNEDISKIQVLDPVKLKKNPEELAGTKDYELNKGKTLEKIAKNAEKKDFTRKDKRTCCNLEFSSGAYREIVMEFVKSLEVNKSISNDNGSVKCVKKEDKYDQLNRHVETLVNFKVRRAGKDTPLTVVLYHTNQKVTIQGKGFLLLTDSFGTYIEKKYPIQGIQY